MCELLERSNICFLNMYYCIFLTLITSTNDIDSIILVCRSDNKNTGFLTLPRANKNKHVYFRSGYVICLGLLFLQLLFQYPWTSLCKILVRIITHKYFIYTSIFVCITCSYQTGPSSKLKLSFYQEKNYAYDRSVQRSDSYVIFLKFISFEITLTDQNFFNTLRKFIGCKRFIKSLVFYYSLIYPYT